MSPDNEDRAAWGLVAITAFRDACAGSPLDDAEGVAEAIGDLIANLMHLARREGIDPEAMLTNGRFHFEAEEEEERDNAST